jgi:hypothetical protein
MALVRPVAETTADTSAPNAAIVQSVRPQSD